MAQQRLTSPINGSSSTSQGPDVSAVEKEVNMLEMKGDSGHFSMIRQLHLADLITEMNGFCGAMSVFSSMRYCLDGNHSTLWLAMYFMPFGLFFDFMDGKVARWRKKSSLLGQELDSLADLISFGVAPAACAFACGFRTFIDTLILTVFILCGLSRLARFNVTVQYLPKDKTGKSKYFEGTPIPTTLSIVGILAFWLKKGWVLDGLPWGLIAEDTILEFHPAILLFFVHACAMVSKTLKIPKP